MYELHRYSPNDMKKKICIKIHRKYLCTNANKVYTVYDKSDALSYVTCIYKVEE